jgi:hypothetical protein
VIGVNQVTSKPIQDRCTAAIRSFVEGSKKVAVCDESGYRYEYPSSAKAVKSNSVIVHRDLLTKIIDAAEMFWHIPDYDCPGGPPELCGYQCGECKGFGDYGDSIAHKAGCVVPVARALIGRGGK